MSILHADTPTIELDWLVRNVLGVTGSSTITSRDVPGLVSSSSIDFDAVLSNNLAKSAVSFGAVWRSLVGVECPRIVFEEACRSVTSSGPIEFLQGHRPPMTMKECVDIAVSFSSVRVISYKADVDAASAAFQACEPITCAAVESDALCRMSTRISGRTREVVLPIVVDHIASRDNDNVAASKTRAATFLSMCKNVMDTVIARFGYAQMPRSLVQDFEVGKMQCNPFTGNRVFFRVPRPFGKDDIANDNISFVEIAWMAIASDAYFFRRFLSAHREGVSVWVHDEVDGSPRAGPEWNWVVNDVLRRSVSFPRVIWTRGGPDVYDMFDGLISARKYFNIRIRITCRENECLRLVLDNYKKTTTLDVPYLRDDDVVSVTWWDDLCVEILKTRILNCVATAGTDSDDNPILYFHDFLIRYVRLRRLFRPAWIKTGPRRNSDDDGCRQTVMIADSRPNVFSLVSLLVTFDNLQAHQWRLTIVCGKRIRSYFERHLRPHLAPGSDIEFIELAEFNSGFFDVESTYNFTLKDAKLWHSLDADTVLVVQDDGMIVRPGIEQAYVGKYDYVGGPWKFETGFGKYTNSEHVGNGGLSLRNVHTMIKVCEASKVSGADRMLGMNGEGWWQDAEDKFFSRLVPKYGRICPRREATFFSCETVMLPSKERASHLGFHKLWPYNPQDDTREFFELILRDAAAAGSSYAP